MPNYNATTGVDIITQSAGVDTVSVTETNQIQAGDFFDGAGGNDAIIVSGAAGVAIDFGAASTDATHGFHNYEGLTFDNTSGTSSATFNATQFGTGLISNSVTITGTAATQTIFINNAVNFSAAPWIFVTWADGIDSLFINGSGGSDNITGSSQADIITGGSGNDTLSGANGNDSLSGGDGNDSVSGSAGDDTFAGGTGNDSFWFSSLPDISSNGDHIVDFTTADRIDLSFIGGLSFIGSGAFSNVTGQVRYAFVSADTEIQIDSDGNGISDRKIVLDNTHIDLVETFSGSRLLQPASLVPTSGNDTLTGLIGNDSLNGLAGNDSIGGNTGNDTLSGGDDNDTLDGGAGNDSLDGGAGSDFLYGGNGDDTLVGGVSGWILRGGPGNDSLDGSAYTFDYAYYDDDTVGVNANLATGTATGVLSGNDTLAGIENLQGGSGNDTFTGNSGANYIFAAAGNDSLNGGDGNDTLDGSTGNNTIDGGSGVDTANVNLFSTTADLSVAFVSGAQNTVGSNTVSNVENLNLSSGSGNDTLIGAAGNDTFDSGLGNDSVSGGDGSDNLYGTSGDDTLAGGAGNDAFYFFGLSNLSSSGDHITDLAVGDRIDLSSIAGLTIVGTGSFSGVAGQLRYVAVGLNTEIQIDSDGDGTSDRKIVLDNFTGNLAETNTGSRILVVPQTVGTSDNDTLTGLAGDDSLNGLAGNDSIGGNTGNDTLSGGDDNDTLDGGAGNDSLDGGAGSDFLYGGNGDDTLVGGVSGWILRGGPGNDSLDGSAYTFDYAYYDDDTVGVNANLATGTATGVLSGNDTLAGIENLQGGSGNDTFTGNSGANYIFAAAGNDSLNGGDGNDFLNGGSSDDTLAGGIGNDTFYFGSLSELSPGGDRITDLAGGDRIDLSVVAGLGFIGTGAFSNVAGQLRYAVAGLNTEIQIDSDGNGTSDRKIVLDNFVGALAETNAGSHIFVVQQTAGTPGNDTLTGTSGNDSLNGLAGADGINGGGGDDTLLGGDDIDTLDGGDGNDSLDGGTGSDFLYGGNGNDTLVSGVSGYWLRGGPGNDSLDGTVYTFDYADFGDDTAGVNVDLSAGTAIGVLSGNDTLAGIENLQGGSGNDTLIGNNGANNIYAAAGNDSLNGGDGNDWLDGNTGANTIDGGAGVDTAAISLSPMTTDFSTVFVPGALNTIGSNTIINAENLYLTSGSGNDTLVGAAGNDTLDGGRGNDSLDGVTGTDQLSFSSDSAGVNANLATGTATGSQSGNDTFTGIEGVSGGNGSDTLTGDGGANTLYGWSGNDSLSGGDGNDYLDGSSDSDTLNGEASNDTLFGGDGNDSLNGGDGNDYLDGGIGDSTIDGGAGADTAAVNLSSITTDLTGAFSGSQYTIGSTTIVNAEILNVISGSGNDTLAGGTGTDTLSAGSGNDSLSGLGGNDSLIGVDGGDTLSGGDGNDSLNGGNGGDSLLGSDGVDFLTGATGDDTLAGGAGNDSFSFTVLSELSANGDHITDLDGGDQIFLNSIAGLTFIGTAAFSGFAGQFRYAIADPNTEIQFDSDGNGVTDAKIVLDNLNVNFVETSTGSRILKIAQTVGTASNDTLTGSSGNDSLSGLGGNDSLIGVDGGDTLSGGDGNDSLNGGNGGDSLLGSDGVDFLTGATGDDTLAGGAGNDSFSFTLLSELSANGDHITDLDGGDQIFLNSIAGLTFIGTGAFSGVAGQIRYAAVGANTEIQIDSDGNKVTDAKIVLDNINGTLAETFTGSRVLKLLQTIGTSGNDTLTGGAGDDSLNGLAANDSVIGNDGNDTLLGSEDNDTLSGGNGADLLLGGDGNDSISASTGDDTADGGTGNDTITDSGGNDSFVGGDGNDSLSGSIGLNTLDGGNGNDTLIDSTGNSLLIGGDGNDSAYGSSGNDTIDGGAAADTISGGTGNDFLAGSDADDFINGDLAAAASIFSVSTSGVAGNLSASYGRFSPDGTKIVFASSANNLVTNDTNNSSDIFVRNLSGVITTTRVSTTATGAQTSGSVVAGPFSPDGNKVIFSSSATTLVSGDTNNRTDIFIKDLTSGAVTRVSTDSAGAQVDGNSINPVFSADGTKIVFSSTATNLVAGDTNGFSDIFVKNLVTGAVTLVSTAAGGTQANGSSVSANLGFATPLFSPDGTKVAFTSTATNLVPSDTNGFTDLFIKDLATGAIIRVSIAADGSEGNGNVSTNAIAYSPDGKKIAFSSAASNLVANDTNGVNDVFIKDLLTGEITRVSTAVNGGEGNGSSANPEFTPDGSKLLFNSFASNFVPLDANISTASPTSPSAADIFVKDLTTGAIMRLSVDRAGIQGNDDSTNPFVSPNGAQVAFVSQSTNLLPGGAPAGNIYVASVLPASGGNDTLAGGVGNDTLIGASGQDTASYVTDTAGVTVDLVAGTATGPASGSDTLVDVENIIAGSGNDTLIGNGGNNILEGGPGDDSLEGGDGLDTAAYLGDSAGVIVDLPEGSASGPAAGTDRLNHIENATGGPGDDTLTGDAGGNSLDGQGGDDSLEGGDGGDTLDGGSGDDLLKGDSGSGNDNLQGGTGDDVVDYSADTTGVIVDLAAGTATGVDIGTDTLSHIESVIGGSGNDNFVGGGSAVASIARQFLASTTANGTPASNAGTTNTQPFSVNGDKIIFLSDETDLTPGDTAGITIGYIKDLVTGTLTRVSVASDGSQSTGVSDNDIALSPDGNSVVWAESFNGNIYVKNLTTGSVVIASGGLGGTQPVFSPDGTKVLFDSYDSNLGRADTFLSDLATGTVTRISVAADGSIGNGSSSGGSKYGSLSADGTTFVFDSLGSNFVPSDTNGFSDIFLKDLTNGTVTRVSTAADGTQANGNSFGAVLSADGTKVAFYSVATNLVPNDTNSAGDIFIKDLTTGVVTHTFIEGADTWALSADGTKIVFESLADNLVLSDTDNDTDVFLRDLTTGQIIALSVGLNGLPIGNQGGSTGFSPDGHMAFYDAPDGVHVVVLDIDSSTLAGGAGNDTLTGGAGNDSLDGGDGTDTANFSGALSDYAISLNGTTYTIADNRGGQTGGTDTVTNIENFQFSNGTLTAAQLLNRAPSTPVDNDAASNTVAENAANGTVVGITAQSTDADGPSLQYSLTDNAGGRFAIDYTTGVVTVSNGTLLDYETATSHQITVQASDGTSTASQIFAIAVTDVVDTGIFIDDDNNSHPLNGTQFNDTISGNGGNDTVNAGDGNDTVTGGDGNDQLFGQNDNDTITDGDGSDTIDGGAGDDVIRVQRGNDSVNGGLGADTLVVDYTASDRNEVLSIVGTNGAALNGNINDGVAAATTSWRVNFSAIEKFDVTTGSGNDNIALGLSNLANRIITNDGNDTVTSGDGNNTISSGDGNDIITTGDGADSILAGAGDDFVSSGTGDDVIDFGTGINGWTANKSSNTNNIGIDFVAGTYSGLGAVSGNFSYTTIFTTGSGNDTIITSAETRSETLDGGSGNDLIEVQRGNDSVNGGLGADTLVVDYTASDRNEVLSIVGTNGAALNGNINDGVAAATTSWRVNFSAIEKFDVTTGSGNDNIALGLSNLANRIIANDGNDTVTSGDGNNTISSGDGNDIITTGDGADSILAGAGDDFVSSGTGDDVIDFGTGINGWTANKSSNTNNIGIDFVAGTYSGLGAISGNFSYTTTFTTGSGNDTIITSAETRSETLDGGSGNDLVEVQRGNDSVNGGLGADTLVVDYTASDRNEVLSIVGTNGAALNGNINDGVAAATTSWRVNFSAIEKFDVTTGSGNDNIALGLSNLANRIITNDGNDTVTSGDGNNTISSGDGNDIITTGDGADSILAGAGDDFVSSGTGDDVIDFGTGINGWTANKSSNTNNIGIDFVAGTYSGLGAVSGNFSYTTIFTTGSGNDTIITSAETRSETLDGGSGNDLIEVQRGNDSVNGGLGADTLVVDYTASDRNEVLSIVGTNGAALNGNINDGVAAATTSWRVNFSAIEKFDVTTGSGNDNIALGLSNLANRIIANDGNDTVTSGDGNDSVDGGAGTDNITAGSGADTIIGGPGNDSLNGSADADTAVYTGARTNYTVSLNGSTYTIVDNRSGSPDGTDSVTNVETFQFSTGTFTAAQLLNQGPSTPTDTNGAVNSVPENSANGTPVGVTANSTDVDGPSVTYSLTDNAGGRFAINSSTGMVTVANGTLLDFEAAISHQITVQASDGTLTASQNFTIAVSDVVDTGVLINDDDNPHPLNGTQFDDTINGNGGNDTVVALDGNDTLTGAAGNDSINSGAGNDTLAGGPGSDSLIGGTGNDLYLLSLGDGTDLVVESGTAPADLNDIIQFSSNLTASDIAVIGTFEGGTGYGLKIIDIATGDSVELQNQLTDTTGAKVETLRFGAAGSTIDLTAGIDMHATSGNETIYGSLLGDTYHVGPGIGHDLVAERGTTAGANDVLQIDGGLTASDIAVIGTFEGGTGYGLKIIDIATGDSVELQNQLTDTTGAKVETLRFGAAGSTIDLTAGIDMHATSGNETIYGSLLGDTYHIGPGIGHDLVAERGTTAGANDVLQIDGGLTASDIAVIGTFEGGTGYGLKIIDIATGDSVELQNQLTDTTGAKVETLRFGAAGSTIDLTTGIDMHATSGNETIYGSLLGDTYHVGPGIGHDLVAERGTTAGANDVLQIDGGLTASDIAVIGTFEGGTGYGLKIIDIATGDSVELQNQLTDTTGAKVETLRFGAAGSTIDLTAGIDMHATSGNETIYGSLLGDTYHVGPGIGHDLVAERGTTAGANDVLQIDGGLTASDIAVIGTFEGGTGYGLKIIDIATGDSVELQNQLTDTTGAKVETLRFGAAGSTIDLTAGIDMHATSGNETIYGSLLGDTYHVGPGIGHDLVAERGTTAGANDVLQIDGGLTASDIAVIGTFEGGTGYGLKIIDIATGDSVELQNQLTDTTGAKVETLRFGAAGSTIDLTTGIHMNGLSTPDAIWGSLFGDTVEGNGGNDTLNGRDGNDSLTGGPGNDTIDGGAGNDTAVYSGASTDYTISVIGSTTTIVDNRPGSPDGTDRLINVENFQFANHGPAAVADVATAVEAGGFNNGTAGADPAGNVLTNDTDPDTGDTKTVQGVAAGTPGGPLSTGVGTTIVGTYGSLVLAANGSYTYTIDNANAGVQALKAADHPVDTFTYTMKDTEGGTSTTTLTVTVNGANDAPSEPVDNDVATNAAAENSTNGALVGITAHSTDVDGPSVTYNLTDNAGGRFAINGSTGVITVANGTLIDFETASSHQITVSASDGTLTASQTFTISVTNVNENTNAPVFTSNNSVSTLENVLTTAVVYDANATDADGDTITYSLSAGGDNAKFSIDPTSGVVKFLASPNFEAPADAGGNNVYDITVHANDGLNDTPLAVAITVTNVNDNTPVITSNGGGTTAAVLVAENSTAVTTVTATDADGALNPLTFSLAGGADAAKFAINGTSGALTFIAAPNFEAPADAGLDNIYDVTVQVSDGTNIDTQAIAVTVTNVNDNTPVITSNGGGTTAAVSVAENSTAVTTVTATDADAGLNPLTFSLAGGADAAKFSINGTSGALSFISAPNFEAPADAGGNNVYDVTVQVSDGTNIDTQAIAVTVTDVNENTNAPVFTSGNSASTPENVATTTVVYDANATDANGDTITYSLAAGGDNAKFSIDPTSGEVKFLASPDFEAPADAGGNNVYDIVVHANDGLNDTPQAVAITVTNVNDNTPVITSNGGGTTAAVSVAENSTAVTTVTATDADAGLNPLTFSLAGGADAAKFSINGTSGALSFISAPNFEAPADAGANNVYDVTVQVSDGTNIDTQTIAVTVTNVNDNTPVITSNGGGTTAAVSVAENSTAVTTVTATDADGALNPLTFSLAGGADAAKFAINGTSGALTFIAAPNFETPADAGLDNIYDVTVQVSDGTNIDTQAIAVTVTNVNDNTPVITSNGGGTTAAVSVAENSTAVTTVTATDADAGLNPLTFSLAGGADAAKFSINGTSGALSFISAPNFEAPADAGLDNIYDVTVQVSDGTNIDIQAIAVTVTNVNENGNAPVFTSGNSASTPENVATTTVVYDANATDADGDTITYSLSAGGDNAKFSIDPTSGVVKFLASPNFEAPADAGGNNVYDITVHANDGLNDTPLAVAITVTNVNDNTPVITSNGGGTTAAVLVAENSTAVTTVTATDADGALNPLTFSLAGGADAAKFAINGTSGALTFIAAPNFETPADAGLDNIYDVTVQVSDGTNIDTQAIAVTVTNVNDNTPVITSNGGGTTAAVSVAENSTAVTTVTATDADAGLNPLTFSLAGGADAAKFSINGTSGALSFISAPNFEAPADAGLDNIYDVTVQVSDGTNIDIQAIAVTVTNVNENGNAPVFTSGNSASTPENVATTTVVYDANATDADGDTITYSLSAGGDNAKFSIDPTSGVVKFLASPNFEAPADAGGNNVYDITVHANDGLNDTPLAVAITVTNVNDNTPVITSNGGGTTAAVSVAENSTAVTTVTATDADAGLNPLTFSLAGGADAAKFSINGTSGALSFISAPNFEAPADAGLDNIYDVTVQVSDGTNIDTQAIAVTVTNVNDNTPVITSNGGGTTAAVSVAENSTAVTTVTATDADAGLNPLTFSLAGGADAAKFSINGTSGALSFISAPNFEAPADAGGNNVYDVTVQVSDGTNIDTQAIAVTVTDVNENTNAPVFTSGNSASTPENVATTTVVYDANATDANSDTITYSLSAGGDNAKFSIDPTSGVVKFLASPDFEAPADAGGNNVYDITVHANDGVFDTAQAVAITVTDVNDNAPVFTSTTTPSVAENSTAVVTLTTTDADTVGANPATFTITGGADAALFTITDGNQLAFIAARNYETQAHSYAVQVTASDGVPANNTVQSLTVSLTDLNDNAPVFDSGTTASTLENIPNTTVIYDANAHDNDATPANNAIVYSLTGADAARFTIDGANGEVRFLVSPDYETPLDAGANNVYNIVVHANDGTNDTPQAVAISVTDDVADNAGNHIVDNDVGHGLLGTAANDTIEANGGDDTASAGDGDDMVTGGEGRDLMLGQANNDSLDGGNDNDTLDGGSGRDQMTGGLGDDVYYVDDAKDAVKENAGEGNDSVHVTIGNYTLGANVDNLYEDAFINASLRGNAEGNNIGGNGGDDSVFALAGDDVIDGGSGSDTMYGGTGSDLYYVDSNSDSVNEYFNEGADTVVTGLASHTLAANVENLIFDGGISHSGTGNISNNAMTGDSFADTLTGGAGSDTLDGGAGADSLAGGTGNDSYIVDDAGDAVVEKLNEGADTVLTSLSTYTLGSNIEKLVYTGVGNFAGIGNNLGNTLTSQAGDDTLTTGTGGDNISAGSGADSITSDAGGDIVHANDGNDTIDGGAGNDSLFGDAGADSLIGGVGSDYFTFNTGEANGDAVADFSHAADDRLYFSGYGAGSTLTHGAGDAWIVTDGVTAASETIHLVNNPVSLNLNDDYYFI